MTSSFFLIAQSSYDSSVSTGSVVGGAIGGIVWFAIVILLIASLWKIFAKAGQPGWASLIPIYNAYILTKIVGRPGWWVLLLLIPFVNFIAGIILTVDLVKSFGKGIGFALGLILLSVIFLPLLAFGDAKYQGAKPATL